MKNKKAIEISVKIAVIIILFIGFMLLNDYIDSSRKSEFEYIPDSNSYAYQVESIIEDNDYYVVRGWFFELKSVRNSPKEIDNDKDMGLILYNLKSKEGENVDGSKKRKKGIALNVERKIRLDVNDYFKCEYDYSKSGFEAKIKKSDLDTESGEYQIIIKPDQNLPYGIDTDAYIMFGKLQSSSLEDENILDIQGTDLEEIVTNGYCLASCPENHIYIYQYEKKLYWIADSEFPFEGDGGTYIQYQIETTQFDKLPNYRTDNGWYWSTIGGDFESYEISSEMNCGKYRVCVRDIPDEYAITQIITGYYVDDRWIWKKSLRPKFLYLKEKD